MNVLKPLKILALLLLSAMFLRAQGDCLPNPYPFFCFDRNTGLPSNRVNCIAQDQAGFWWFGTETGLLQFDGHAFRAYRDLPGDSTRLSTSILALYLDRRERFWVVTNFGVFQLDTASGRFVPGAVKGVKNPIFGFPSRMVEDSRGDLWLASSIASGLLRLRRGSDTWEAVPLPEGVAILGRNIQEDPQTGHVWLMFQAPGKKMAFGYIDPRTGTLHPAPASLQAEVRDATHFVIDGENNFWASHTANSWLSLYVVRNRPSGGMAKRYSIAPPLFSPLFSDRKGRFWYVSENRTDFGYYEKKSGAFKRFCWPVAYNNNVGLKTNILDFFEDKEGNIWISTDNGVFVFNPDKAVLAPAYALKDDKGNARPSSALSVAQTADSKIWTGTYFGGTYWMDKDFQVPNRYLYPIPAGYVTPDAVQNLENFNTIWAFCEDRDRNVWAGGQAGVLVQFSPSVEVLWKGHFRERTIRCMAADAAGDIWLGTTGGILGKLNPETREAQLVLQAPQQGKGPIPRLLQILPDRGKLLWLVYTDRILGFDPRSGKVLPLNHRPEEGKIGVFPATAISQAVAWNDSTYLVLGNAIHWFDKKRRVFSPVPFTKDIAALGIKSAVRDGEELWLVCSSGIVRWSPKTGKTVKYDLQDGVPVQFHEVENSAVRLSDGRILAAWGTAGFMVFHPDSLRSSDPAPPKVRITGLSAMGKPLPFNPYLERSAPFRFKHSQNFLTLRYACFSWRQRYHLRFRYRVLGYSNKWVDNGSQHSVSLAGLPPGRYVVEIEVRNREGQTASSNTLFPLRMLPPWYLSWPALLGYALLFGLLGYRFYRFQLKRRMDASEARYLREMDTFKTNFYTNITHEFRTPLTVILGMADQVQENPSKYFHKGLEMIRQNGLRLLELVNQVLELSKLESGKLETKLQRGDGITFLQYLTESYISYAESRGVELSFFSGLPAIEMDFDPEKVQQVFVNLLSNAIKYTPSGGQVRVQVDSLAWGNPVLPASLLKPDHSEGVLAIRVLDTGIGISPEDLKHVFDRYYQVKNSRSDAGTGIGLTLALELARWMQGDIQVESEVGKGTAFVVYLPVLSKPGTGTAAAWVFPSFGKAPAPIEEFREEEAFSEEGKPRLLLVEDSADVLQYLQLCLRPGYQLQTATNGRIGLEMARDFLPDLIISDVMMPEMDGMVFCGELKQDIRTSHIPVVLLTARAGVSDKIEGLDRGADAYLVKPFDRGELLAQVRQLLEQRQRLQEYYRQAVGVGSGQVQKEPVAPLSVAEERFLKRLQEIVEARLTDPDFGASELERALGMSHAQLFRKMKALLGYSAVALIRKVRIRKAQELLGKKEMNMSEIAFAVGFKEPAYFSRVFKEETGVSPGEWENREG